MVPEMDINQDHHLYSKIAILHYMLYGNETPQVFLLKVSIPRMMEKVIR